MYVALPGCIALTLLHWLQVARQEGEYLARLLKQHNPEPHRQGKQALLQPQKPFKYTHLGSLAYVGADKAVMDIPKMGPVTGWTAGTALQCLNPCGCMHVTKQWFLLVIFCTYILQHSLHNEP